MSRKSPSEYMREYHNLRVSAVTADGRPVADTCHVTKYQVNSSTELYRLLHALEKVLGRKAPQHLNTACDDFRFAQGDVMGSGEPFFWQSLRRAFGFRLDHILVSVHQGPAIGPARRTSRTWSVT